MKGRRVEGETGHPVPVLAASAGAGGDGVALVFALGPFGVIGFGFYWRCVEQRLGL